MSINSINKVVILLFCFLVYALSGIFSKHAALQPFGSLPYLAAVAMVVLSLGIYAVLWQKILSFMPLHKAFLCKSVCIVIILAVSHLLFREPLTLYNLLGGGLIVGGIVILSLKK